MRIDNFSEYLINNNIKPSYIRLKVLEYLIINKNHPTVDIIYNELIKEIPTLSKTTVYNTLNTFFEKGVCKIINIDDNTTRYDANTLDHGHFKCEKCKGIYDFSIDITNCNIDGIEDFIISKRDIYFKGLCRTCNNN